MRLLWMLFVFGLLLVFVFPAAAGEPETDVLGETEELEELEELDFIEEVHPLDKWDDPGRARSERTVNVQHANTVRRGALLFVLDHRTWKTFTDDPGRHLLGFDNGQLKIGLGVRYGIFDNLDVGLRRINGTALKFNTDNWDLDLKYNPLRQDRHFVDLAVGGGMTWYMISERADEQGWFGQLLLNRTFGRRVRVGTGLLYHSDSYNESRDRDDPEYSTAVPLTLDVRFSQRFSWHGEMVTNVGGFEERYPVLSTSLRAITNRHTFAFVVSNTQYFGATGIATNTFRDSKDLVLGFTITREFRLWRPED